MDPNFLVIYQQECHKYKNNLSHGRVSAATPAIFIQDWAIEIFVVICHAIVAYMSVKSLQ